MRRSEVGRDADVLELMLARPDGQLCAQRSEFGLRLAQLDGDLLRVADEVAGRVPVASKVLLDGDRRAAGELVRAHQHVRERCRRIEEEAIVLIARQAPVASDLRGIIAVLRAVHDVERASRNMTHVVESLEEAGPPDMTADVRALLSAMSTAAHEVLTAGVEAWRSRDGLAVNDLARLDDEVDLLQERLLARLYTGGQAAEDVVELALTSRWYERLADHGVALARHVSWAVTGDRREG